MELMQKKERKTNRLIHSIFKTRTLLAFVVLLYIAGCDSSRNEFVPQSIEC